MRAQVHPILFALQLAGHTVTVRAYGFFLALGILTTLALGFALAVRAGLPRWRAAAILVLSAVTGLVGARLLNAVVSGHLVNTGDGSDPGDGSDLVGWSLLFDPGFHSFSLYGALIVGAVVAFGLGRLARVPSWRFLDALVPGVALGIALARVGCFLNGCCFGTHTNGPTGVTFPAGSLPWLYELSHGGVSLFGGSTTVDATVHPTQLYETGGAVGALALALGVERIGWLRTVPGARFLVFAAAFSAFRLLNLHFRAPVFATAVPSWFYPLLYGLLITGCATALCLRATGTTRRGVLPEARLDESV